MPPGWDATRATVLEAYPRCWLAYDMICLQTSTEVHHVFPGLEGIWALRGVCSPCHKRVTGQQAAAARRAL
jgi:hypothetical protein